MADTHLARLTPAGTSAIATLALRGPAAWSLVREFSHRQLPPTPEPGRFWLTRLGTKASGESDDVVVSVKQSTPDPWLEIHCHGGSEVVRFLVDLFANRGVVVQPWQQFGAGSNANKLQTAALAALAKALTLRTAAIALDQFNGAFTRAIWTITAALRQGDLASAEQLLGHLERYSEVGRHLAVPWRVVIAGAPNVGKSTLVNALVGYQRSIVSPTPGTTRDVVTTLLALDGWPVEIADTAGWRLAEQGVEREGIARARDAAVSADLCLWLLDASAPPVWPDANLGPVRYVINKNDLAAAWPQEAVDAICVSALTGAGLPELCTAIAGWLVPDPPPSGAAVPCSGELAAGIIEVRGMLQAGHGDQALNRLQELCGECD